MRKYLHTLRKRSDEEKTAIVRTFAIITTGVIFVIYLLILAFVPRDSAPVINTQQEALNAFSTVLDGGISQFADVSNQIQDQSDQLEITPENLQIFAEQIQQEAAMENNIQQNEIDSSPSQNIPETESLNNQQTN